MTTCADAITRPLRSGSYEVEVALWAGVGEDGGIGDVPKKLKLFENAPAAKRFRDPAPLKPHRPPGGSVP
jgi:hypothetical protein